MLAPFSLTQALDTNGRPLRTAVLMIYQAGTTTPAILYRQPDYAAGTEFPNPIPVNGYGLLPAMYGRGTFKFRLLSAPVSGSILWEVDGIALTDPVTASSDTGQNAALIQTGQIAQFYGAGSRAGYVRANGRSIGTATSGATERASADTLALYLSLWSEDDALVVAGGRGASGQADFDANKALSLPDARGRILASLDGMGAGAGGGLAGVSWNTGGSATRLGSYGGAVSNTLGVANIPLHRHDLAISIGPSGAFTYNGVTGAETAQHIHSTGLYSIGLQGGPANLFLPVQGGNPQTATVPTNTESQAHGHPYTVTVSDHNHNLSYSMGDIGSGAAFTVLPPVLLVTTYLKL